MSVKGTTISKTDLAFYVDAANITSYDRVNNRWRDLTTNVNVLTLQNNPTFSTQDDGILTFNGSTQWSSMFQPNVTISPNNAWTIAMWIKPQYQANAIINPAGVGGIQSISYDSTEAIRITICDSLGANIRNRITTSGGVPSNQWKYVVISINNLEITVYVDGVLDSTFTETLEISPWSGVWFLFTNPIRSIFYLGSISNLAFYDRILTNSEILQNYNALNSRFV